MRRAALALTVLTLLGGAGQAQADQQALCGAKNANQHKNAAFGSIDHAYRHKQWRDASLVTNDDRNHWQAHKSCLGDWGQKRVTRYRDNAEESRDRWRKQQRERYEAEQFRKRWTPYDCGSHGDFAIPCYIVACESEYNENAYNSSSGAAGWYQILYSTWRRWGGGPYSAKDAPDWEQHVVARRIWEGAGASQWSCA